MYSTEKSYLKKYDIRLVIISRGRHESIVGNTLKLLPDWVDLVVPEKQVRAFRLADNKVGEIAEWDSEKLTLELMNLDEEYMAKFGFEFEFEDEAETEAQKNKEKRIKALELKSFEHHDYLVFVFDNQQDWLNVVSKFDIGKVDAGYRDWETNKQIGRAHV